MKRRRNGFRMWFGGTHITNLNWHHSLKVCSLWLNVFIVIEDFHCNWTSSLWLSIFYRNSLLQVEGVELSYEEASHQTNNGKPPWALTHNRQLSFRAVFTSHVIQGLFSLCHLSKLERGFHWNSIQPWGENWPKKRLIFPLQTRVTYHRQGSLLFSKFEFSIKHDLRDSSFS